MPVIIESDVPVRLLSFMGKLFGIRPKRTNKLEKKYNLFFLPTSPLNSRINPRNIWKWMETLVLQAISYTLDSFSHLKRMSKAGASTKCKWLNNWPGHILILLEVAVILGQPLDLQSARLWDKIRNLFVTSRLRLWCYVASWLVTSTLLESIRQLGYHPIFWIVNPTCLEPPTAIETPMYFAFTLSGPSSSLISRSIDLRERERERERESPPLSSCHKAFGH